MLMNDPFVIYKILFYAMVLIGAIILLFNMVITLVLKSKTPGGFTGKWLATMWLCMFLFFMSEGAGAFFFMTSFGGGDIFISYFFISFGVLSASVFIAVANRFIYRLIKELESRI